MLEDRQIHHLPMKESEQTALARKMGVDNKRSVDSFMHLYQQHTQQVKNIFDKLFTPVPPPADRPSRRKQDKETLSPAWSPKEEQAVESFKNPDKIRSLISLLKEGHTFEYPTQRSRELFDSLLNTLLVQVNSQPEPELALNRFEEFARGFGAREALFGFLLENRPILEYLILVLGTGGILCERLIQYPDFLDLISGSDTFWEEKSAFQMRKEIEEQVQKATSIEEKLELLAKYKMEEEFRIGFRLIVKNPDPLPIFEELSVLAQLYLEQVSSLAFDDILPQDNLSLAEQFAIVAVGKFGGKEIDFGSDLDVVFVTSESENSPFFHKICRKIIKLSQTITKYGIPYRIDLDLRPYGKSGPLVTSLSGFQTYYHKSAKPWERMAWIRSRVISGKGDLFCRIHESIKDFVYSKSLARKEISEIELIWEKVHQEKTTNQKGRVSLKFGSGGLFDLEFITQLLQLKHGNSFPDVQRGHTYQALLALEQNECIPPTTAKRLKEAYLFLRSLESRLRLTQNQPGDWISLNDEQWENLSKRMRIYPDSEKNSGKCLRETFKNVTTNIKQIKSEIDSLL
jgi:glutamate-ammonia-ligase adenylyltransferase